MIPPVGRERDKSILGWLERTGEIMHICRLAWSTDSAASLRLVNIELPKRDWGVTIERLPDSEVSNEQLAYYVTVQKPDARELRFFEANSDSYADAVTQCVCQIAESEAER